MAKRPPESDFVDADLRVDLDALWAGVSARLVARGLEGEKLKYAEGLFWLELGASEDWLKITTAGDEIELVAVLAPAFERRFIAKAVRLTGGAYVRSA